MIGKQGCMMSIWEMIREDLKAEGINKIISLAMLKAFIASPTMRYLI